MHPVAGRRQIRLISLCSAGVSIVISPERRVGVGSAVTSTNAATRPADISVTCSATWVIELGRVATALRR